MRLFIDLDLKAIIQAAGTRSAVTGLSFKRGDSSVIDCYFVRAGVVQELAVGATGIFALKELADYGGDFVVSALTWTKFETGANTYYRFIPSFNTAELNDSLVDGEIDEEVADETARFALTGKAAGYIVKQLDNTTYWTVVDGLNLNNSAGWVASTQKASVSGMLEIEWIESGAVSSIATVTATVPNDVIKGTEGVPTAGTPAYPLPALLPLWRIDITALTGGTASDLDSLVTATGLYDDKLLIVYPGGTIRIYLLVAGTDAEDSPGIIRPDDYAASTNEKVWKSVL